MADSAKPAYDRQAWQEENELRTKELTDKLEAGIKDLFSSDKYKEYLKSMSHFHNYSSRNIMLIHSQMPTATRVASFKLWKEQFNRTPKRGETSLRIFAPIEIKPKTELFEKVDPATGKPILDDNDRPVMEELTELPKRNIAFKLVPVFDVSQTVGEPLPHLAEDLTGNVEHYEAFLDSLKAISPLPIVFEPMDENQDGYCQYGVKIGIREGMSEIQTVSAIIHEITHARLHDRDKTAENEEKPASKDVKEIEAESVSYVVCQKYGIETGANSFGYLATWSTHDLNDFRASQDTIRKEANTLINAIDDRFKAICKERGIDLTATEQAAETPPPTKAADTPAEPQFTTETTTENIAGVDFTVSEVVPDAGDSLQTAQQAENAIPEQQADIDRQSPDFYHISSGPTESGVEVWNWNETEDKDGQPKYLATINFDREITYLDDTLPDDVKADIEGIAQANWKEAYAIEMSGMDYDPPLPPWEREPMPDPSITAVDRDAFGYTAEDILPLNKERAIELWDNDHAVFLLYSDNTEAMVFEASEIEAHDGIFGIEREDWQKSAEYRAMDNKTNQQQAASAVEQSGIESPSTEQPTAEIPDIPRKDQPIYTLSADEALQKGEIEAFHDSRKLNVECGRAIDQAVIASNYEMYRYDLNSAIRGVIEEYGADRVGWVLAGNVNYHNFDGRLTNASKDWAKGFGTPEPDVHLQSHMTLVEGLIDKFRKVEKEKPSLMSALDAGERKSKAEFDGKAQPGLDTPDKSKNKTGMEV